MSHDIRSVLEAVMWGGVGGYTGEGDEGPLAEQVRSLVAAAAPPVAPKPHPITTAKTVKRK